MADALVIETQAQCRLADEYDAVQERGELRTKGGDYTSNVPKQNLAPTANDVGLTRKQVHEARNAERAPGTNALKDPSEQTTAIERRISFII